MSDDFDKDDIPWLQGDDDDSDEGSVSPPPGGHLGFTGELPWKQDDEGDDSGAGGAGDDDDLGWLQETDLDSGDDPTDEDFDLDWLRDPTESVTGELNEPSPSRPEPEKEIPGWLQPDSGEAASDAEAEADVPDWLQDEPAAQAEREADDDIDIDAGPDWLNVSEDEPAAEPGDDVPDWLQGEPAAQIEPEPDDDDIDIDAGPDWLNVPVQAEPDPLDDVPDWLLGTDEASAADPASMIDDTGGLSSAWLASGESLPDTIDSDKTFDQWMQEQAEAEREPDLEEQMPDLGRLATDEVPEVEASAGDMPAWFLGMEEMDTSDAPDWFTGETPSTDSLSASPLGDWLQELEPAVDEPPAADVPEPDEFDFLSEAAVSEVESGDLGEDFFADLGASSSLDNDFLAEFGAAPAGEAAVSQPMPDELGEDFFADLGAANGLDDDFLADLDEEPAGDEVGDDFFADLDTSDLEAASTDFDSLDTLFGADDDDEPVDPLSAPDGQLLQSLGIEDLEGDSFDWFNLDEDREAEPEPDAMGWLDDLGEIDEAALTADSTALEGLSSDLLPAVDAPGLNDIDSLLASMGDSAGMLPETGALDSDNLNFDELFSDPAFSEIETPDLAEDAPALADESLRPETPDWLTETGASVSGASAASILRQQRDRPVDELPDRLKRLRQRASSVATSQDVALTGVAPDIDEVLVRTAADAGLADTVSLTADQERRVDLLNSLTANEQANAMAASRAATDEPFLLAEDQTLPDLEAEAVTPRTRRRIRIKVDRLLIALVLAAGVIAPFFIDSLRIGDPPPAQFVAGSRQQAVFDSLDTLQPGDLVLVGIEYGPTAAAELDGAANVLLRHILARRAQPVVVSQNPIALVRTENILDDIGRSDSPFLGAIGRDTPLRRNEDYMVARYLSGDSLGLRALSENIGPLLSTDLHGEPTGLTAVSLADFARIVVVAERPTDLRAWAEQVAPLTNAPLLAAVGYAGEPLAAPYVGAAFDGLMAGYGNTLTYAAQVGEIDILDTRPALEIPTIEAPVEVSTPEPGFPATIGANQNVNVRGGPGAGFPIVASVSPGEAITMLGRNDIGTWLNIRQADGTEGWISIQFVDMGEVDLAELAVTEATPTVAPTETTLPTETPLVSDTPAPTETPAPTDTPGPTSTEGPTSTGVPTDTPMPTETATATATATETPSPVPSATPETDVIARITASDSVNIRSGPGTQFAPVGAARPGDEYPVLGRNADGSWIQIDYPDLAEGQEAWIAEFLVEITAQDAATAAMSRGIVVVMAGSDFSRLLVQDADPEATEEATPEVVADSGDLVAGAIPGGEDRWYAMNLGLIVIIVVIALGTVLNIARAVLRRGD